MAACPRGLSLRMVLLYRRFPIDLSFIPGMPMTITDTHAVSQPFQAEVSELLHLMVHSVYSETDIFLRELISNASDACDRLRYEAIANPSLIGDGEPPKIRIEPSKKANTLVVADSGIVGAYSDNIQFPILLMPEQGESRQINSASALWQRPKSELKGEDYTQAYKSITGAFDEPAMTLHYRAEGRYSYAVLLFAPSTKPFDLFEPARKGKVKLYVRRVFITDDADLLPAYLRFMRGVIDSEDLPLNVSREMLQNNPQLAQIRKAVTSRVVSELETLGDKEPESFGKIWDAFGPVIKEGIYEDFERRDKLLALSRFSTTLGEKRSLKQYVADLKPNQTEIYFLVGDSIERLKSNPRLEAASARGIEVLLLTDAVDAFWTSARLEFEGKPLKSLSQGDLNLDLIPLIDEKAKDKPDPAADEAKTIAVIKASLGDRVTDVRSSTRLTTSASCLVAGSHGPDRQLERR